VSIDHRFLVVTSANMSKSAERLNVELGLVIDDVVVAQGVERQMASFESEIYEVVRRR
jgi:phosphatidylserine/phosphatidylglycerophosphate/cardiolipin synthase-like enzyme